MLENIMFTVPPYTKREEVESFLQLHGYAVQEQKGRKCPIKIPDCYDVYVIKGPEEKYKDLQVAATSKNGYQFWSNLKIEPTK